MEDGLATSETMSAAQPSTMNQLDQPIAARVITPPQEAGDPLEGCPEIHLPSGSAADLIDWDGGER